MPKLVKVATLSLAVLAGACGTSKEQSATLPEDLQKDLAAASAPASDLATAPRNFEPTRVVSAMERGVTATTAKTIVATKKRTKPVHRPQPKSKPAESLADATEIGTSASLPTPTVTPSAAPVATAPEPVVIAQKPSAVPAVVPAANPDGEGDGGMGARRRGGGIGGLGGVLGGIIGGVVIRGGHGGVDKCDPRTDGRRGGIFIERPTYGMPLPSGTFPRRMSHPLL